MNEVNLISRFQAIAALDMSRPVWIRKDLSIFHPTIVQRVIFAVFGCLEYVRNCYNVDYRLTRDYFLRRYACIIGDYSQDLALRKLFNAVVRNFNKAAGCEDQTLVSEEGTESSQGLEDELCLCSVLARTCRKIPGEVTDLWVREDTTPKELGLALKKCPNLCTFEFPTPPTEAQLAALAEHQDQVRSLVIRNSTDMSPKARIALGKLQLSSLKIENRDGVDPKLPELLTHIDWSRMNRCEIWGLPRPADPGPENMAALSERGLRMTCITSDLFHPVGCGFWLG